MKDGAVRVYPLQPNDPLLTSIGSYWSLGVHDNQYGRMQAISSSYDDQYLVTCGADGNIFTFSILSMEDIERDLKVKKAKVPSPRVGLVVPYPYRNITAHVIFPANCTSAQTLPLTFSYLKMRRRRQRPQQRPVPLLRN